MTVYLPRFGLWIIILWWKCCSKCSLHCKVLAIKNLASSTIPTTLLSHTLVDEQCIWISNQYFSCSTGCYTQSFLYTKSTTHFICLDLSFTKTICFEQIAEFEYLVGLYADIPTSIKEDPRPAVKDKLMADLADNNDWWFYGSYVFTNKHFFIYFTKSFVEWVFVLRQ